MPDISKYSLIVGKTPTYNERRAAAFIAEKIKIVTGYAIDVFTDDAPVGECEIIVGETEREGTLGVDFGRERERLFEYELRYLEKRLFITGLGTSEEIFREPYNAYAPVRDCGIGTLYAAHRFCERVLGYDFMYVSHLDALVDKAPEDVVIDETCALCVSCERLASELPEKIEGAALYSIPPASALDVARSSLIFKNAEGEFIVYDGGAREDAERLCSLLCYLAEGQKPTVSAWLISRLGTNHSGALCEICEKSELAEKLEIKNIYCHFLSGEFIEKTAVKGCDTGALLRDRATILSARERTGAVVHTVESGDVISVGELCARVVRVPCNDLIDREKVSASDASVVYKICCGEEQSILLLGDAERYTSTELEDRLGELRSDILLLGHHGRASVSQKCFCAVGADVYIAQTTNKIWYSEESSSARIPTYRFRRYLGELGKKRENVYRDTEGILSFALPISCR